MKILIQKARGGAEFRMRQVVIERQYPVEYRAGPGDDNGEYPACCQPREVDVFQRVQFAARRQRYALRRLKSKPAHAKSVPEIVACC